MDKKKRETEWAEAKRRCRLTDETLAMAKELGLNPRSLIKNTPSRSEPWKGPCGGLDPRAAPEARATDRPTAG